MGEKSFKYLGMLLIVAGAVFIMNSFSGMTGYVIFEKASRPSSTIYGLVFIAVGVVLFLVGLEKKTIMDSAAIKEAVKRGVPLGEAERIYDEANKKIESGEWIELNNFRVTSTTNPRDFPEGTSLCRYWGHPQYKGIPQSRLDRLYKEGKIGKTHEVVRGSDKYALGGSLMQGTISIPSKGSKALHRHWEIDQMHKYQREHKN